MSCSPIVVNGLGVLKSRRMMRVPVTVISSTESSTSSADAWQGNATEKIRTVGRRIDRPIRARTSAGISAIFIPNQAVCREKSRLWGYRSTRCCSGEGLECTGSPNWRAAKTTPPCSLISPSKSVRHKWFPKDIPDVGRFGSNTSAPFPGGGVP